MKQLLVCICILLCAQKNSSAQKQILDQKKYADCLLLIPIDYKNMDANYEESKKYAGKEIIMIQTRNNGEIRTLERGFIKSWWKDEKNKGVFFEHKPAPGDSLGAAFFPLFNDKNTFCYSADCYDSK